VAVAAIGLGLLLVALLTLARRPFPGVGVPFVLGAVALGLLAVWTLLSATWSDAPSRALVEYDRVLLYLLAYLVLGAIGCSPTRLRWLTRGVAAGAFAVCACGLATRLAPDVWSIGSSIAPQRLSYPVTYWNALGLLAAVGFILCFALTSDDRESRAGRVLAAGALPVLGATLLLTFSRGSIAAAVIGLIAAMLVGRPRAVLSGLVVAVPTVAVAVASAYAADLLASANPTTPAAVAQGHDVAVVMALCVIAALIGRTALLRLDRRMSRMSLPAVCQSTRWRWAVGIGALTLVGVAVVASGAPGGAERLYTRFLQGDALVSNAADSRARLTEVGNNGRRLQYRVSLEDFHSNPLRGRGAGTYVLSWEQRRAVPFQVQDAHSLYLEVLGELGGIGLLLVVVIVLLVLGGLLRHARGADRVTGAALFAAALTWAVHAGVDWDWEMPAVTLWVFAAGGLALSGQAADASEAPAGSGGAAMTDVRDVPAGDGTAATSGPPTGSGRQRVIRVVSGLGCLLLLLAPLSILRSEGQLRNAQRALGRGDCRTAIARALDAKAVLSVRPEPSFVLGVCDVRLGFYPLAVRALQDAVARDPDNWEYRYGTALVRGAAGLDPRPAARAAKRLNPRSALAAKAVRMFNTSDPAQWRRRALRARLPTNAD